MTKRHRNPKEEYVIGKRAEMCFHAFLSAIMTPIIFCVFIIPDPSAHLFFVILLMCILMFCLLSLWALLWPIG